MEPRVIYDTEKIITMLNALSKHKWLSVRGRGCAEKLAKELWHISEQAAAFSQFVEHQDITRQSD